MKNNLNPERAPLLCNQAVIASYREQEVPAYRGNPLIEALPAILSEDEAMDALGCYPLHREEDRQAPAHIRYHMIQTALSFFAPLPVHIDLEQRFSRLLRGGYVARNPVRPGYWNQTIARVESVSPSNPWPLHAVSSDASGMTVVGMSGVGKTTGVDRTLGRYPQVIHHNQYAGHNFTLSQIVWLKLACPFDGSIKGLCINFFQAVDDLVGTNYYASYIRSRGTVDEMLPHMARVASLHCLGVLIIDEIQHLNQASSGGSERMLNFFVQLINTIGLPVILIGTYGAMEVLSREFRQIRRGCGQGDLVWDRMKNDVIWEHFVETLWHYQYTRNQTPLTRELRDALYDECQGITDFAKKLYLLAQVRAIATGIETVTPALIRAVAADSLRTARPVIDALRTGNIRVLSTLSDVHPIDFDAYSQQMRATPRSEFPLTPVQGKPVLQESNAQPQIEPAIAPCDAPISNSPPPVSNKRAKSKKSSAVLAGSLMDIVYRKERGKMSPYDALKQASLICSATEFLKQGAST